MPSRRGSHHRPRKARLERRPTRAPLVAVIVGNFNGAAVLPDCLKSLRAVNYPNFRVYLYDNVSTDGSPEEAKRRFREIVLIENRQNLGFTGGNNVAMRRALGDGADYVMLLNNDTVVEPTLLTPLVAAAEAEPTIGIVGPKVMYYPQTDVIYSAGGRVSLWTAGTQMSGQRQKDVGQCDVPRDVGYITGAAILVKRAVLDEIGLLDDEYFAYYEETDWCVRAARAGWRVRYLPEKSVYHHTAMTNKYLSDFYLYQVIRNMLLFMRKNARWYHWLTFVPYFGLYVLPGYAALSLTKNRTVRGWRWIAQGVVDFLIHRWGKAPYWP